MPNIPFIQHARSTVLPTLRRTKKTFESTDTKHVPALKRNLDRRKKLERRKKHILALIERRQRGFCRRKNRLPRADKTKLSDTIGKHINTNA